MGRGEWENDYDDYDDDDDNGGVYSRFKAGVESGDHFPTQRYPQCHMQVAKLQDTESGRPPYI